MFLRVDELYTILAFQRREYLNNLCGLSVDRDYLSFLFCVVMELLNQMAVTSAVILLLV